jgi:serine protease Do
MIGGLCGSFVAGPVLHGQNAGTAVGTAVPKEMTSYRDVVKKVLPAVVSIESRVKPKSRPKNSAPRRPNPPDDPRFPDDIRKFFEEFGGNQINPIEPDEIPSGGFGSGFLVDAKGVILTNYHVVGGADVVEVQLKDGRKFTSKDIKGDRKTDLAIVRINAADPLPALELGDSDAMEIGDRVLAVGAPFGLTGSVTSGIVSAKGRRDLNVNFYEDFIQTDAAINPGNSGGPLVNLEGKVIGINSAIKSRSGGFQGVGLAISSNMARKIMQSLMTEGVVHRGYLGIQMTDLKPDVAAKLDLKDMNGVVVGNVYDGSPASKGGIEPGDIITSFAGKPVKDGRELQQLVLSLPLGRPVDVVVVREGKARSLRVTVEEQPDEFGRVALPRNRSPRRESEETVNLDKLGLAVRELTPEMAQQLGYKESANGVVVTRVERGGLAAEAGLQTGMLISHVDRKPVKTPGEFQDRVDKASLEKGILVQVTSPRGGTNYVVIKSSADK